MEYKKAPLIENVEEMFIGPFGSSLKNDCFVDETQSFCMVYEQKHAIQKTMDVETRYINKEKYDELQRFNVKGGDIIVSCRGTIGETFIVPDDAPLGIMHPSIMKIRLKDGVYDKYYFNTLLKMRLKSHKSAANGSGVKMAISAKELGKELFPIPSIIEQKTITQILLQVEILIAKRKQQLQQLDELVKARFVDIFGDVNTSANTINLESVCLGITDGSHNPPKGIDVSKNYMISSQNIQDGEINYNDVRYLSDYDFYREDKRTNMRIGDVLLTIVGTVGRTAVVNDDVNITSQRSVCIIHPNSDLINSIFLKYMLDNIYPQIAEEAHGIAQKGIYLKQVKKLQVILPKMSEQIEFANFVKQIDKLKFEVQQSLEKLDTLKKSLMQQYFG